MQKQPEEITLYNLLGGALDARFLDALEEVAKNIDDPNTDPTAKRELVVKLTFKPSEQRSSAGLKVDVITKLPGRVPMSTTAFFALDPTTKRYMTREYNPRQTTISEVSQAAAQRTSERREN